MLKTISTTCLIIIALACLLVLAQSTAACPQCDSSGCTNGTCELRRYVLYGETGSAEGEEVDEDEDEDEDDTCSDPEFSDIVDGWDSECGNAWWIKLTWGSSTGSSGGGTSPGGGKFERCFFWHDSYPNRKYDTYPDCSVEKYGTYSCYHDDEIIAEITYSEQDGLILKGANGFTIKGSPGGSGTVYGPDGEVVPTGGSGADGTEASESAIAGGEGVAPGFKRVKTWRRGTTVYKKVFSRYITDGAAQDPKVLRKRATVVYYDYDPTTGYSIREIKTKIRAYRPTDGRALCVVPRSMVKRFIQDKSLTGPNPDNYAYNATASTWSDDCDLDRMTAAPDTDFVTGKYFSTHYTGYDATGRVTAMTRGTCSSCSGGDGGEYTFAFITNGVDAALPINPGQTYPADPDDVQKLDTWKTCRRITLPDGNRKVEYYNSYGNLIYNVVQEMSGTTINQVWITHYRYEYSDPTYVCEVREPSACVGYDYKTSNGWVTEPSWINSATEPADLSRSDDEDDGTVGIVRTYWRNSDLELLIEKIRNGTDSSNSAYYVRSNSYTDVGGASRISTSTVYPTLTTNGTGGITTYYAYTLYSGSSTEVEFEEVTHPTVYTDCNGPGQAATTVYHYARVQSGGVTVHRYRDWTKHPDGTLSYRYDDPVDFVTTLEVADVKTTTAGFPAAPTYGGSQWANANGLHLVTEYDYYVDDRIKEIEEAGGRITKYAYLDKETRVYRAWDSTADKPVLPIEVMLMDDDGRTVEEYTVGPAGVTFSGALGSETLPRTSYLSWTKHAYGDNGKLESLRAYHTIPSSGDGTLSTNYALTHVAYDTSGRREVEVQVVSGTDPEATTNGSVEQVVKYTYDVMGRVVKVEQGVSGPTHAMTSDFDNLPTLRVVSRSYYDEATPGALSSGVGDGRLTTSVAFYDANHNDDAAYAVKTSYHYDWLGRLRGIQPEAAPYAVQDVDAMGRVTATAQFSSAPTWSTVVADDDYASTIETNRKALSTAEYDELGRTFRSTIYAVEANGSTSSSVVTDNFYDIRGRLVGSTSTARGGTEIAYDGAGRMVEQRVVKALRTESGYHYDTSGAFPKYHYCEPQPGDTAGGDEGVLAITRRCYSGAGDIETTYSFDANHEEPGGGANDDGINFDAQSGYYDYIVTTSFAWHDLAGRTIATAAYGTNASTYSYAAPPARPASPPTRSDTELVVSYDYSGNTSSATDPAGKTNKAVYDAFGQVLYQIENYSDFSPADESGVGGGSNNDQDRVTKYVYNNVGQVVQQFALQPSSGDNQITNYLYEDAYDARLVTNIIYPDSEDTSSAGNDQVKITYNLGGSIASLIRPRKSGESTSTTLQYDYDADLGRLVKEKATALGEGVDPTVRAVKYTYDSLSRRETITTYGDPTSELAPLNQVKFAYHTYGELFKEEQEHSGAVDGATINVNYIHDTAKAWRRTAVNLPNGRSILYDYGTSTSVSAAVSRPVAIKALDGTTLISYKQTGTGMTVGKDYPLTALRRDGYDDYDGTHTYGVYEGLDRFGRVKRQLWRDYQGNKDVFDVAHAYDRNSNRLFAERGTYKAKSQAYDYDGLNRLVRYERGALSAAKTETTGFPTSRVQDWTLDQLGNWSSLDDAVDSATPLFGGALNPLDEFVSRAHNKVNEILSQSVEVAPAPYDIRDEFDSSSTASFYTTSNAQSFSISSGVMNLQSSGGGCMALTGEDDMSGERFISAGILRNQSVENGIVFGYSSNSDYYWLCTISTATPDDTYDIKVYRVRKSDGYKGSPYTWSACALPIDGSYAILDLSFLQKHLIHKAGRYDLSWNNTPCTGKVGLYTEDTSGTTFSYLRVQSSDQMSDLAGRWDCGVTETSLTDYSGNKALRLIGNGHFPMLHKGLHLSAHHTEFKFRTPSTGTIAYVYAARGMEHYNKVIFGVGYSCYAKLIMVREGKVVFEYEYPTQLNLSADTWHTAKVRVDAGYLQLLINDNPIFIRYFAPTGGKLGLHPVDGTVDVDDVVVRTSPTASPEFEESFDIGTAANAAQELDYDAAGNLTFDGVYKYTYDAWNRLATVTRAYRKPGVTDLQTGSAIATMSYDGLGRRIGKAITNCADWNATYHYYYDGQRMIETRDGSSQVLQQYVWGLDYVDELCQIAVNQDPHNASYSYWNNPSLKENNCERFFYVMQDANYNVLGVAMANTATGASTKHHLVERYEYTPYGRRTVYSHGWSLSDVNGDGYVSQADADLVWSLRGGPADSIADLDGDGYICGAEPCEGGEWYATGEAPLNDPLVTYTMYESSRGRSWDGVPLLVGPGLCDFGHQGLFHDREFDLVYNRARMLNPALGRFMQRDPLGYVDGMALYAYVKCQPISRRDPTGLMDPVVPGVSYVDMWDHIAGTDHAGRLPPPVSDPDREHGSSSGVLSVLASLLPSSIQPVEHKYSVPLFKSPTFGDVTASISLSGSIVSCRHDDGRAGIMFEGSGSVSVEAGVGMVVGTKPQDKPQDKPRKIESSVSGPSISQTILGGCKKCETTCDASLSLKAYVRASVIVADLKGDMPIGSCTLSNGCTWDFKKSALRIESGDGSIGVRAALKATGELEGKLVVH